MRQTNRGLTTQVRAWRRIELMNNREYAERLTYCWQKSKDHFANLSPAEQGRSQPFLEGGAPSGAKRQMERFVARASEVARSATDRAAAGVRGRSPRWGFGGEAPNGGLGEQSPPANFWCFWVIFGLDNTPKFSKMAKMHYENCY